MKTQIASKLAVVSAMAITFTTSAQTFSGTNAPNTSTNFSFTVGAGATNLSLVISNSATAYSHLYLKRGGPGATNDFDFVARLNGQTNQINLELPEFAAASYGLRVVTPATSLQHAFNVVLTTNAPGLRNPLPALKPVVFSTTGTLAKWGQRRVGLFPSGCADESYQWLAHRFDLHRKLQPGSLRSAGQRPDHGSL